MSGGAVPPRQEGSAAPARVLVVDDDEAIRRFLADWLKAEGYESRTAASAEEGRALLERERFAVLLCDVRLPGMSGMELLDWTRERRPELACLMISGVSDRETAVDAVQRGAYGYLTKPLHQTELAVSLSGAIERQRQVRGSQEYEQRLEREREDLLRAHADRRILLDQLDEFHRIDDRNEAFGKAVEVLQQFVPVRHHRILLQEGRGRTLRRYREPETALDQSLLVLGEEELSFVIEQGRASLIPLDPAEHPDLVAQEIRGHLLVPLLARTGVLGMIALFVSLDETSNQFVMELADHVGRAVASTLEKIRLNENLRTQSDLMDNVLESVPHAMIAVDLDDQIITLNRNAELMFDIRRFFAIKEQYQNVLPEKVAVVFRSLVLMTLKGRGTVNYELEHQIGDKTSLTIGISTSIIHDRDGNKQGVLFICRDLSLTREVEKLRELDKMKSEFVHTVSHELKTPLTAILGGTEILLTDRDKLDAEQQEIVQIVEDGGKRLQRLITDLLDLSKLESGRIDLQEAENQLTEVADETLALLAGRSAKHQLLTDYEPDLPRILFDRNKIQQVMENLVSNAIKYSPGGGKVTVKIATGEDNHLQVDVADHGMGIPADALERVFEKFYRVDSSSTAEIEGTGLGLSIVKHIVEMHGGKIWVTSQVGRGSTFSFKLPIRKGLANA